MGKLYLFNSATSKQAEIDRIMSAQQTNNVLQLAVVVRPLFAEGYHVRPGFPGHVLFFGLCPGVRTVSQKSAVCPGFWPNPQVHSNVANYKGVRRHETKKAR